MSDNIKLSEIRDKILKMNDALFQEMGDLFFNDELRPNEIECIGSVANKTKTKKGTPDTLIRDDKDRVILIEYSTQESDLKSKFINDIKSCFDEKKSKTKKEDIYKIIICSNQRISSEIKQEIKAEFNKISSETCNFQFYDLDYLAIKIRQYPSLLSEYLGINIGNRQLMTPSCFVKSHNNHKIKTATPLDNPFIGRKKELDEGLQGLKEKDVCLIIGQPGVGKTKFALKLGTLFCKKHRKTRFVCYMDKGMPINDDFNKSNDYLILIDDAHNNANFKYFLERFKDRDNIKILATVRDYAMNEVRKCISEIKNTFEIKIDPFEDKDINVILDDFGIKNREWKKRIVNVSKCNTRIALMCAQLAKETKKFNDLNNVEEMYNVYYHDQMTLISEDAVLGKDAFVILAIISFFRVVRKDNFNNVSLFLRQHNISDEKFWNICSILDKMEILEVQNEMIVKISEQTFATYLFYRATFVEKKIDLNFMFSNFSVIYHRINDSLCSVMQCFRSTKNIDIINSVVRDAWYNGVRDEDIDNKFLYLKYFAHNLRDETLLFLKSYVNTVKPESNAEYELSYQEDNNISAGLDNFMIIISSFKYEEDDDVFDMSLDLMFDYLQKRPRMRYSARYMFKEMWGYDNYSANLNYKFQLRLFRYLIQKSENSELCKLITKVIIPHFMKFEFNVNESYGDKFVFNSNCLSPNEGLFSLRSMVFDFIEKEKDLTLLNETIRGLYNRFYFNKTVCKKIAQNDKVKLFSILYKTNLAANYTLCKTIDMYFGKIKRLGIIVDDADMNILKNENFILEKRINYNRERIKFEEREMLSHNNLRKICNGYNYDDYIILFNRLEEIEKENREPTMTFQKAYILENIISDGNKQLYLDLIKKLPFEKNRIIEIRTLNSYWNKFKDSDDLYDTISRMTSDMRSIWLWAFSITIPEKLLTESILNKLKKDFIILISSNENLPEVNVTFVINKLKFPDKTKIYNILLDSFEKEINGNNLLSSVMDVLEDCISYCPSRITLIEDIFINIIKKERDKIYGEEKLFIKFVSTDLDFLRKYINSFYEPFDGNFCMYFDLIWTLDNYQDIIRHTIDQIIKERSFNESDKIKSLFTDIKDWSKAVDMINYFVDHYYNTRYINIVFRVVVSCLGSYRADFYVRFIKLNNDIEVFKNLALSSDGLSFFEGDSDISTITLIQEIVQRIKALKNIQYIEHIHYLVLEIESYRKSMEASATRCYIRNMYK